MTFVNNNPTPEEVAAVLQPAVLRLDANIAKAIIDARYHGDTSHGSFVTYMAARDYGRAVYVADAANLAAFGDWVKFSEWAHQYGLSWAVDQLNALKLAQVLYAANTPAPKEASFGAAGMTFEEFLMTSREVDDLGAVCDDDDLDGRPGWVLGNLRWIQDVNAWPDQVRHSPGGRFYTVIERSEYQDNDFDKIARLLYDFDRH